jgi:type II secretory pathway pseudopilin PulG
MSEEPAPSRQPWIVLGLLSVAILVGVVSFGSATRAHEDAAKALQQAEAAAKAAEAARQAAEKAARESEDLRGEIELLSVSVANIERNIKQLSDKVDFGGAGGSEDNPFGGPKPGEDPGGAAPAAAQPVVEFTPELRESLRKAVEAKGVALKEDRVEIPGVVVLRQGALEYLAVFPGGKAHESIFLLTGTPGGEGERVEGLGAALNSCLMALGLRPGTPIRFLPGGKTVPARGTPVCIAVEWEEDGKPVRVRAEDLLWDRERSRSLDPGEFLYVGSYFHQDGYVPDLTGDAVAVYSVQSCVVDLADPRAANDTIFVACGPRVPPEGTKVRMVFSPKPLEPTRTWDPADPQKRTDGSTAPVPGGGDGK